MMQQYDADVDAGRRSIGANHRAFLGTGVERVRGYHEWRVEELERRIRLGIQQVKRLKRIRERLEKGLVVVSERDDVQN